VPTHFFKIVIRETQDGGVEALTVLLPHWRDGRPPGPLKSAETVLHEHLVSIKEVQELTGLDLLPFMETGLRERLERAVASELWPRN
jgi:hypothetical protein